MILVVVSLLTTAVMYTATELSVRVQREQGADTAYNMAYAAVQEAIARILSGHAVTVVHTVYGADSAQAMVTVVAPGLFQVTAGSTTAVGGTASITAMIDSKRKMVTAWSQQP